MNDFSPNRLPPEPGRGPAIILAVTMHLALFMFLWIGIQWQNKEVTAVEAEVWDLQVKDAAPKPVAIEEPVEQPVVKEAPPPPPPVVKEEPKEDPEIAIEQKKKLKEKQEAERKQELAEAKRKEDEKEKLEKLEKQKIAEKAKEDKKKADQLAQDDAAKQMELKKQQAKEKAAADRAYADNMRRLTGQVAGSGGTGDAPKSTGNNRGDPSYAAKLAAKIVANTSYANTDVGSANPTVEFKVTLLPDGSLRDPVRKIKSSGVPGFDDAVEKAIGLSAPFPKNSAGVVPPEFMHIQHLKDKN